MSDIAQVDADYLGMHGEIIALLESARHPVARNVNALMTASYWKVGHRIVEFEQGPSLWAWFFFTQYRANAPLLAVLAHRADSSSIERQDPNSTSCVNVNDADR